MDLACPICRYPFGSGGNLVQISSYFPSARSFSMICSIKFLETVSFTVSFSTYFSSVYLHFPPKSGIFLCFFLTCVSPGDTAFKSKEYTTINFFIFKGFALLFFADPLGGQNAGYFLPKALLNDHEICRCRGDELSGLLRTAGYMDIAHMSSCPVHAGSDQKGILGKPR